MQSSSGEFNDSFTHAACKPARRIVYFGQLKLDYRTLAKISTLTHIGRNNEDATTLTSSNMDDGASNCKAVLVVDSTLLTTTTTATAATIDTFEACAESCKRDLDD